MSAREEIAKNIVNQLENMTDPAFALVNRDKFDIQKLAITQFPAVLVVTANEDREDISVDERQGLIQYQLRCYVRGTELDTARNKICEGIEETLELSRNRDITLSLGPSSIPLIPLEDLPLKILNFFDINLIHLPN